jgi:hypothetical protein
MNHAFGVAADMAVLPGVLGSSFDRLRTSSLLRRTIQVRLRSKTLRLPGGTPIFTVSRRQFMKHPGWTGCCPNMICQSDGRVAAGKSFPRGKMLEKYLWGRLFILTLPALSLSKGSKGSLDSHNQDRHETKSTLTVAGKPGPVGPDSLLRFRVPDLGNNPFIADHSKARRP